MESGDHSDAYAPREMARKAVAVGVAKANLGTSTMFLLAVLAGAFIALGACFCTTAITGVPAALVGPGRVLGGLAFCLGLILVVVGGAELFTGNMLMLMALLSRRISLGRLARNWAIVYVGNLVGSVATAVLVYYAMQWKMGDGAVGAAAYCLAGKKLGLTFVTAFCSGVLCNLLVCLAVWLCYSGRSVADKVLAILFPITAFVALGFEHSVANMFFIPYGMMLARTGEFASSPASAAALGKFAPSVFTIPHFVMNNLLPVTLGNIVGGGLLVGVIYWLAYLRGKGQEPGGDYVLISAEQDRSAASVNSQP